MKGYFTLCTVIVRQNIRSGPKTSRLYGAVQKTIHRLREEMVNDIMVKNVTQNYQIDGVMVTVYDLKNGMD